MKILHIIQCANLGGMEKATFELMSTLNSMGYENRLVSLNPMGGLGPLLEDQSIPAKGLDYRGPAGIFSIPQMAYEFRNKEADGMVMSGHNIAAFTALAGWRCKKRLLYIHYHHRGVKPEWQWRAIYTAATRLFPRVAFCTDFIREEAEEIYPPLRSIALTVRYPFELPAQPRQEDRTEARKALGIPEGAPVVGNAGWLIQRKRWDVYLRTVARILERCPDAVFLACGDGPLRERLAKQSLELGLDQHVRWVGWQGDLRKFYLAMDVLLFNSDWDALGRTPLEAGAYEVPVVASVLEGGLREVITSDNLGFLINRHDEDWLADKTVKLLSDSTLRLQVGASLRRHLGETHAPKHNAMNVLALLGI
jgi:glycosyltransferase involved in cell wall biosynthesis